MSLPFQQQYAHSSRNIISSLTLSTKSKYMARNNNNAIMHSLAFSICFFNTIRPVVSTPFVGSSNKNKLWISYKRCDYPNFLLHSLESILIISYSLSSSNSKSLRNEFMSSLYSPPNLISHTICQELQNCLFCFIIWSIPSAYPIRDLHFL